MAQSGRLLLWRSLLTLLEFLNTQDLIGTCKNKFVLHITPFWIVQPLGTLRNHERIVKSVLETLGLKGFVCCFWRVYNWESTLRNSHRDTGLSSLTILLHAVLGRPGLILPSRLHSSAVYNLFFDFRSHHLLYSLLCISWICYIVFITLSLLYGSYIYILKQQNFLPLFS